MKFAVLTASTLLLAACGGGGEQPPAAHAVPTSDPLVITSEVASERPIIRSLAPVLPPDRVRVVVPPPTPVIWPVATSEQPALTIEDEFGRKIGAFDLQPVRGKGYPELKITLTARRIGDASPPEPVRPSCKEAGRCEYNLSRKYEVSVSDEQLVQLVPRGDGLALVARSMKFDEPKAVEIAFSLAGQALSTKRIALLAQ